MAERYKILIVEDEEIIRFGLQDNFEMENYIVETAVDGEEAIEKADTFLPHLILLDLMIPKKSGFEVCRYVRKKHPECLIIMLTAKTEETSKVAGLEMGADDYVTKPFSILELLARVKAFLRRFSAQQAATEAAIAEAAQIPECLDFFDIHIDIKRFEATKNGVPLDLTNREFQVLKYFWNHKGDVITREELLKEIWGFTDENMPSTRTIDNHIVTLRKKIEDDQTNPKIIISVRGAGYKLDV
ncbi:MAG: response regulator transcription factor [Fibrobacter sp.]|nr:response regulator transcription factor [Fibrobacter sp.]